MNEWMDEEKGRVTRVQCGLLIYFSKEGRARASFWVFIVQVGAVLPLATAATRSKSAGDPAVRAAGSASRRARRARRSRVHQTAWPV